jgi:phosphogluconate dehydratase
MARVYPNGLADVNHFHAAGGLGFMIGELLDAGLLHPDVQTVAGDGLARYAEEPKLIDGALQWQPGAGQSLNPKILRPAAEPFQPSGGLRQLDGNLGRGVIKTRPSRPNGRRSRRARASSTTRHRSRPPSATANSPRTPSSWCASRGRRPTACPNCTH